MKLLVTGAWNCTTEQLKSVENLGYEIIFMQNEKDALPTLSETVEGVIGNDVFLHHDIRKFENLKYIQLTSAGFDRVPLDYINAKNIKICNARGVYSIPMAEFAVCGVLQLYKQTSFFYDNFREKKWEKSREIFELFGKKVCIVGCGSVGTETAKRFSAFGCEIVGIDIAPYQSEFFGKMLPLAQLDEALSDADVVVLTLPLTNETENLFDSQKFSRMKNNAVFVNVARGKIVNTDALIYAIKNKHIYGAVLDVFENEPLEEESPLWNLQNVVITPHNSFVGEGNSKRLFDVIYENLRREMKA